MATAFGVQLKKADGMAGSSTEKGVTRTPGGARRSDFRTAPVSDLKAMFDKTGEKSDGKTTVSSVQKTTVNKTIKSSENSSSEKTSSSRTTEMKTKTEVSSRLSTKDKEAFELLKNKINQCGVESLLKDEPSVAVAKTFGSTGKTYKATVENKLSHDEENVNTVVTKSNAVSVLSFGLTKLRTRPESLKGDDEATPHRNSLDDESNKKPTSLKAISQGPLSPKLNQGIKDTKYIPGAARGWKTKTESKSENEVTETKVGKFNDSSVGKVRKDAQEELAVKGFRSVSPVNFIVNSSDDSSGSCNISPRGYKPNSIPAKAKMEELTTDINENIKKFESSKSDSNLLGSGNQTKENKPSIPKTSSGTKISAAEQLALDKDKVRSSRNSGNFSSDSDKGKQSPRVKGEMKWMDKSRISSEEFKQQTKAKGEGHRPLSRASSSGSNSSFKQDERSTGKSDKGKVNSPRSIAPSVSQNIPKQEQQELLLKKDTRTSKKLGTLKFQDIKKGFETKAVYSRSDSPSGERKPQLEIKTKHKFLERKQSFEGGEIFRQKSYENKEVLSPRDKGNVLQTIKALTELDAKAKAKPSIVRRTQSLPIEHLGDDSSLDYEDIGDGAYYHDIEGIKAIDDLSNEGDISSEADLYEEIPANVAVNIDSVKEFKNKRGAFKKKKKTVGELENTGEVQTGSEGDIDSDTDSSNSGIYEPIDHDEDEDSVDVVSESDSVNQEPPELPPARTQNNKKKKDKGDNKKQGLRGKIKKLYKGKSMDSDSVLKSVTASGMAAAPQSVGIIDRLKKKTKSANSLESLNKEDNPVCESEGTDTDFDPNSPRSAATQGQDLAPPPPPLPPRRASSSDVAKLNSTVEVPSRKSANVDNYMNNKVSSSNVESDPPLPPRNRISNKLDLNVVVPVNPGGDKRKSAWPPGKDSYLHGQKINNANTHSEVPYIDQTPSPKSPPPVPEDAPPLPQRPPPVKRPVITSTSSSDSYVDVGDRTSRLTVKSHDSYVDVDAPLPLPDSDYSLADEIRRSPGRKELDKRPVSSGYIKPHDLATVPEPRANPAPFEDVYKFCGPDDDILYIDLSDDQVYGTSADRYKSQFETESLYQFYNKDKITRASKRKAIYSSFDESDEEGYFEDDGERESVYEDLSSYSSGRGSLDMDRRPPEEEPKTKHISTLEMFGKKGTVLRALWAEMPEVKASGVLDTITPHERKLQESMFEIITSEATYLKSLNVLIDVFLRSEEFGSEMSNRCILTKQERHVIFSNIGAIRDTSEKFLAGLESRWKESVILSEKVCDIIREHASKNFECYVHYCSNQTFQDKAVTELKKKQEFVEVLRRLESHPDCQGLPMISFLLLPMQRITRLPLLVDAICHRIDPIKDKARHKAATNAFNALSKVVKKCNEGAKKMQQTEQMYHIAKQIDFPASKEIPQIPLISASRYVVKQGEVVKIVNEAASRLPFGKAKPGKQTLHVYLFNDIMLFTKKKGDRYVVTDYGPRNTLHADIIDNPEKHARVLPLGVPGGCKHLFLLVMLENFEKKQVEMVFSCNSLSDRARWVDAVTPVKVTDDQRIYEEWDCPQVQCIKKYLAQEPDELSLEESDVVNVFKKLEDGMYEGERLRDGERGWFPKDHTVEIVNSHVRARNLRMKYRLMQASEYS